MVCAAHLADHADIPTCAVIAGDTTHFQAVLAGVLVCNPIEPPMVEQRAVKPLYGNVWTDYLHAFRRQVRRSDVQSAWSGIRPLAVDPRAKDTASALRDHIVLLGDDGLVTVTGADSARRTLSMS